MRIRQRDRWNHSTVDSDLTMLVRRTRSPGWVGALAFIAAGATAFGAVPPRGGIQNGFVDCNNNGIDDSTDIANCDGSPGCDDCNLNGIPDECDIADETSQDGDGDGVPDECGTSTGICGLRSEPIPETPTESPRELRMRPRREHPAARSEAGPCPATPWSNPENWNLSGLYPNDLDPENGQAGVFTTVISGQSLILDVDAWVPALRLAQFSQLLLTTPGDDGDLGISPPAPDRAGRILIRGSLQLGDGRTVGPASGALPPDVTIDVGGTLAAADPNIATSATLTAGNVLVTGVDCFVEPCEHSGLMDLTQGMALDAQGDVTIDGSATYGECAHTEGSVASFHVPPSIRIRQADVNIDGSLTVLGAGSVATSESTVTLGSDFNNQSVRPECFDCLNGSLLMDGDAPQFFEVSAKDVGPIGSLGSAEFAIGTVTVASGSTVTFRDVFDNDLAGQTPCTEALYVGTLTLGGGSNITLEGCRVYSQRLNVDSSVTISCTCDHCLQTVATADADGDGLVRLSDWAFAAQCMWGPEEAVPYSCLLFDLHADDHIDLRDAAIIQRMIIP